MQYESTRLSAGVSEFLMCQQWKLAVEHYFSEVPFFSNILRYNFPLEFTLSMPGSGTFQWMLTLKWNRLWRILGYLILK